MGACSSMQLHKRDATWTASFPASIRSEGILNKMRAGSADDVFILSACRVPWLDPWMR